MACIRKRRGKWTIDFYDQFGKRHWETLGTSKKEAEEVLAKRLLDIKKGTYQAPISVPTFSEVSENWFQNYVIPNTRHFTAHQYKGHLVNHLLPFFGKYKLTQINIATIEKYINGKLQTNLSRATINKILVSLGAVFKYAVKHRLIEYNPVREVERLKGQGECAKEIEVLSPKEINSLLAASQDNYRTLFLTAILTGMREGELLGLTWDDIDWQNNQIFVRRTYNHGRVYEPKSKWSRRKIDIPSELNFELKKWKLRCPKGELNLVFPNSIGNPESESNMLRNGFFPTLRRAGLRRIRLHDLRHNYASLLIKQGEHPKYIQSQMGHSSIKVTMDIYGHLMDSVNHDAPRRLWRALFETNGSKMVAETEKDLAQIR